MAQSYLQQSDKMSKCKSIILFANIAKHYLQLQKFMILTSFTKQNLQPVHSVGNHLINKGSSHLIQIVWAHPENEEKELFGHEKMLREK